MNVLNTLFVTTAGAYVGKDHETAVVRVDKKVTVTVPLHLLGGVVCFGPVSMSPALMAECAERGIGISFLTGTGKFQARVEGPLTGNVLLRRGQYRLADDETASLRIARGFIIGKIANARQFFQRAAREAGEPAKHERIEDAVRSLKDSLRAVEGAASLAVLRGVEGEAAATYFKVFGALIRQDGFDFVGRSRRPPIDAMNSLLSFLYALITHDASSALQAVGLDPCVGYLHVDRPGRPSLALDLVEEFRPAIADRLALSLVNLRQVASSGFVTLPGGEVQMSDDTRKEVLTAYQRRKQEVVQHPFLGTEVPIGTLFHLQARLLARVVRGDLDAYPPYVVK